MARIAGINIPPHKHAEIGLTAIFGIGRTRARQICDACGIAYSKKIKDLSDAELEKVRDQVGTFTIEGDLRRETTMNIKRLMDIGCYRGFRHRRGLQRAKGRFTTRARSADLDLKRAHAVFLRLLGAIFGSDLRGERGRLARTLEALGTGRRPGNRIALRVGDGDHGVVEGRVDVRDARRDVLAFATADACGFLGHGLPFDDLFAAVMPAAPPWKGSKGVGR